MLAPLAYSVEGDFGQAVFEIADNSLQIADVVFIFSSDLIEEGALQPFEIRILFDLTSGEIKKH